MDFAEMAAQFFNRIGQIGLGVALVGGVVNSALYNGKGIRTVLVFRYFVTYQSDGGRNMSLPCFVRFEVFIMMVTVIWDVM